MTGDKPSDRRGGSAPGAGGGARPAGPPPDLMQAVALHQRGQLQEAEALYVKVLKQHPQIPEALALYGYLTHQRGDDEGALARIDEALKLNPRMVDAHLWRGMALQRLQRFEAAAASYREALRFNPRHVDALNNLGTLLTAERRYAEAAELHRAAIQVKPDRAQSHYNLGVALQRQGLREAAVESFERAIAIRPDLVDALNNLGVLLIDLRRSDEALVRLQRAIELDPHRAETYLNLPKALENLNRFADTETVLREALELNPDYAEARVALANTLQNLDRLDEAIEHLRYVRETRPDYLLAASNLLMKLIYKEGVSSEAIAREHREIGPAFLQASGGSDPAWRVRDRDPDRRLRVGYVSPDYRAHSCAFFLEPLLAAHDRAAIEPFCYSNTPRDDAVTERIRRLVPNWCDITKMSDREAAQRIAADRIDILMDCAGHTAHNRLELFALKPAPLQGTWLGYPHGTGLPTIDFRLTDAIADPPGPADEDGLEPKIRLPDGFLCYRPLEDAPEPVPGPFERGVAPVFGCFNNCHKIGPAVAELWASILAAVPDARLKLRSNQFRDATAVERYRARLTAAGIAADRLTLSGWAPTIQQGLADYANIDVALDPFPYNGTTTTCEALWMGVPVVALAGDAHAGRVGASLLARVGLEELVARDAAQYREIAIGLLQDRERLARYRRELRGRMAASPLCDASGFARAVEKVYRERWRGWCATGAEPPASLWSRPAVPGEKAADAVTAAPVATASFVAPGPQSPRPLPADKPVIRVLHNMARSGGTLIAQCIGVLPGVALLSEIHPDGVRFIDPLRQARDWYGLIDEAEAAELAIGREGRFLQTLQLVERRARERGLALVLRDWSHLDFIGLPQLAQPTGRRRLVEALAAGFGIRETCTVRHPIDQWQSTRRLNVARGLVRLEAFIAGYRRYAEMAAELGFLKYEDFCAAPEWGMRLLAQRLDLAYDARFLEHWAANPRVTGDRPAGERRRTTIVAPRRRPTEPGLLERFERHPDYLPALALLGYRHPI